MNTIWSAVFLAVLATNAAADDDGDKKPGTPDPIERWSSPSTISKKRG